ncbi:beta-ketoacyl-ACP synthase III [Deferrisoma palaeochoriense]
MTERRHPPRAAVLGTGRCLPDRVVTNHDLEARVDTSDEWIRTRTGIRERRIAPEGVDTCDLCEEAARQALDAAGLGPDDLDLILVATVTPALGFPATACLLQDRLGTRGQMAFDLSAGCTGFLYALAVADGFIRSGAARHVLAIGAETLSRIVDWDDRATCVLFGDGAGAVVLGPSPDPDRGVLATRMAADGSYWPLLHMPGGGSRHPPSPESLAQRLHYVKMQGNEVFKVAVRTLHQVAEEVLEEAGVHGDEVDWFVPHQANRRIIDAVRLRLKVPEDRVYVNVDRYGNTSAASVPIALDEMARSGKIRPGHLVLLDAFGAGFTYGAALIRW